MRTEPMAQVCDGSHGDLTYGHLVLNADGSYTYTLDNTNPAVQALNEANSSDSMSTRSRTRTVIATPRP
ncbi:VCBS domain-containing protein [Oligella ureolytica]|uniref:VCBS domain-containing protein n=1 Tax=Oligella ureolytica TaxID=90244 RepID=UPI000E0E8486|nr:VCBS domain-containing protein [Oligella ureolytica]